MKKIANTTRRVYKTSHHIHDIQTQTTGKEDKISTIISKLRSRPDVRTFLMLFDDGECPDYASNQEKDLALCKMIASETLDAELIEAVFKKSGCYRKNIWAKNGYGETIIQQAITAAKASKGIPNFIVQTVKKGKLLEKLSVPLLTQWVRDNVCYRIVRDDATQTLSAYLYENGVYSEIDSNLFEGIIKEPVENYNPLLVDIDLIHKVYKNLITDRKYYSSRLLNAHTNIINFENGILKLDDMTLVPHSPDYMSTIQIPAKWVDQESDTPVFDDYMETLTNGDKGLQTLLLQYMGVCLSNVPGYLLKKYLILYGEGNTGKSQLKRLLEMLLGSKNCCPIGLDKLESEFGPINLRHKRLAGSADMNYVSVKELSTLKSMTGSDSIFANRKGQTPVSFVYTGLFWFCANRLPKFGGDDGPWVFARICPVYCGNVIPEAKQDKLILEKMYAEREGIIYKAVMALLDVIDNGYKLSEPQSVIDARATYSKDNSVVSEFVNECLEECRTTPATDCSSVNEIYRIFTLWCKSNNHNHTLSKKEFKNGLARHFDTDEENLYTRVSKGMIITGYTLSKAAYYYT